jgi:predicted RNA binding protein YcfA (HicA-like mRNA interferase family)
VTKRDKLRRKLRNNPVDVTMREVQTLLENFGFVLDCVSGSHHLFVYEVDTIYHSINIPLHGRKVKKLYVSRVSDLLDELFPEEVEDSEDDSEND